VAQKESASWRSTGDRRIGAPSETLFQGLVSIELAKKTPELGAFLTVSPARFYCVPGNALIVKMYLS
jgi:hypothetical protein